MYISIEYDDIEKYCSLILPVHMNHHTPTSTSELPHIHGLFHSVHLSLSADPGIFQLNSSSPFSIIYPL